MRRISRRLLRSSWSGGGCRRAPLQGGLDQVALCERRLHESRVLLETTDWGIDAVASVCGFGSTVTFRQNFASAFGTTPSSYRRQFSG